MRAPGTTTTRAECQHLLPWETSPKLHCSCVEHLRPAHITPEHISLAICVVQGTVEGLSQQAMKSQAELMDDVKEIKGYLATFGGLSASAMQTESVTHQHDGRLLQV